MFVQTECQIPAFLPIRLPSAHLRQKASICLAMIMKILVPSIHPNWIFYLGLSLQIQSILEFRQNAMSSSTSNLSVRIFGIKKRQTGKTDVFIHPRTVVGFSTRSPVES